MEESSDVAFPAHSLCHQQGLWGGTEAECQRVVGGAWGHTQSTTSRPAKAGADARNCTAVRTHTPG